MSAPALAFLVGLAALGPVLAAGLVPASLQGMTQRPGLAAPYGAVGALLLFIFTTSGWAANRYLLAPTGLGFLLLPALLVVLAAVHFLLGLILRAAGAGVEQLPINLHGSLAMGGCLLVISSVRADPLLAACGAAGMSAGHLVAVMVLSFLRERAESRDISPLVRGWPLVLGLCSLLWLASKGLGSLVR